MLVPSVVKDENGKVKKDSRENLEYERQPRRTPVHSILCESKPRRSILLATLRKSGPSQIPADNGSGQSGENVTSNTSKRKRSPSPTKHSEMCSQVILSIQLEGDELDIHSWRECIRLFPVEAKHIKIEGVYKSFSTLLLLRMPVAFWNLLPSNPAYKFVGYVTSGNQAPSELVEEDQALFKASKSVPGDKHQAHPTGNQYLTTALAESDQRTRQKMSLSDYKLLRNPNTKAYKTREGEVAFVAPPSLSSAEAQEPKVAQTEFIQKLYNMLEDESIPHILSWSDAGDSFDIVISTDFARVLWQYFKHMNIEFFMRQLKDCGIYSINVVFGSGFDGTKWIFKHSGGLFKRGDPVGLQAFKRQLSQKAFLMQDSESFPSRSSAGKELFSDKLEREVPRKTKAEDLLQAPELESTSGLAGVSKSLAKNKPQDPHPKSSRSGS